MQFRKPKSDWRQKTVAPGDVMAKLEPGMSVFISTGVAEPRTFVKHLLESDHVNVQDLELVQLVSFGDAVTPNTLNAYKFRLRTFFSGWMASEPIASGRVDLIPSRFARLPLLIKQGRIRIDAAVVQVTPPNEAGYCSLGAAVDVARMAMESADIVIAEINDQVPMTYGDTFVPLDDFDFIIEGKYPPIYFKRWQTDEVFDRVAANVSSVIEDGACLGFSLGPLFESLSKHLARKKNLGIHTPFFTDAMMDMVNSGAVTNRYKRSFKGRCLASYALGTKELMAWLDKNPLVDFQGIDKVFDPVEIGKNNNFMAIFPARKVDLSGRVALHAGKGNIVAETGEAADFVNGAELSRGGKTIFALPSRNRDGSPNIVLDMGAYPNLFGMRESVDMIITEYGVANLQGRSVRERAQAMIDIAHPADRPPLVEQAKEANIIYKDQIYLADSAHLYPDEFTEEHTVKGDLRVRFRAIRPSDEDEMRQLFYRFSDQSVYYRYFSPIKSMPHSKMQEYVNIDYRKTMSIVALVGRPGEGHIIGEARYVRHEDRPYADVAFVVDEQYQGRGLASLMLKLLIAAAKKRGLKGFTADVLANNVSMMKVFERSGLTVKARLDGGVYELNMPFTETEA